MSVPLYSVQISARATFVYEQSDTLARRFVFVYFIKISNHSSVSVQLLSRHWIITDADMSVEEVKGMGVVGEQPKIRPGQSFEYNSGCVLSTPVGTMQGFYRMRAADGIEFDAEIPVFTLKVPHSVH